MTGWFRGLLNRSIIRKMAHNDLAVYDVLPARKRKCAAFPEPSKCGREKTYKGAMRRLRLFGAPAAYVGEAYTDLLCAVPPLLYLFSCYRKNIIVFYIKHRLLILLCPLCQKVHNPLYDQQA
jgi:hypothetical protein